jgi:cyclohexanecarboxylate-CoA ligase
MTETFWGLVDDTARAHPARVLAVDDHGRSLTATRLRDEAESVAAGLVSLGAEPGNVVSWQLPTTLEAIVLMAACARLGVVQNPIIPLLRDREVGLISSQLGTKLLVVPEVWRGFDHGSMGRDLGLRLVACDFEASVGDAMRLPSGDPSVLPAPPTTDDDCRWIYFSSGTTADPKGARHTDASVMASALGMVERLGFSEEDVYPIAWPFTHIGGIAMLTTALRSGVRLVLFDVFDPATTAERMATFGPTMLGSAVPFFRAFLDAQARHGSEPLFPRVRGCVGGGAPIPGDVNQELIDVFGVSGVAGAYGLTEFPMATCEWIDDPVIGTTVGPASPGVTARIVDGELRLRGGQCFLGYVDESLDARAFDDEGWFRTGDLASIDEDGRISIVGRLKDVIIRNAENISATEVEEAVLFHPDVIDVAVIGLPDTRTGERVCAAVVLSPGVSLDVAGLGAHCTSIGLARYKCPEQIVVIEAIERNPMGKIQKDRVRSAVLATLAH